MTRTFKAVLSLLAPFAMAGALPAQKPGQAPPAAHQMGDMQSMHAMMQQVSAMQHQAHAMSEDTLHQMSGMTPGMAGMAGMTGNTAPHAMNQMASHMAQITEAMQGSLAEMQTLMRDSTVMGNPDMTKNLRAMQSHMSAMTGNMHAMLDAMQQMRAHMGTGMIHR